MWGGLFGTKRSKIKGVWNPYIYPIDEYGRTQYLKKKVYVEYNGALRNEDDPTGLDILTDTSKAIRIICPCDGKEKFVVFEQNQGHYKYLRQNPIINPQADQLSATEFLCPKNKVIHNSENEGVLPRYTSRALKPEMWMNSQVPEKAEITLENFGKFDYKTFVYKPYEVEEDSDLNGHCYYEEVNDISQIPGCSETNVDVYGYIWRNTDIKMVSLEGKQDSFYIENATVQYRAQVGSANKEITLIDRGLFRKDDTALENEVLSYTQDDLKYSEESGLVYKDKSTNTKLDIYLKLKWDIPNAEDSATYQRYTKVKIGTFYIIDNWNSSNNTVEEMIYPINSGLKDVKVLDRIEKVFAKQTFAIDANRNLRMNNYRYMPEYASSELTVFIDPKTMRPYEPNTTQFVRADGTVINGNLRIIKQYDIYYKWTRSIAPEFMSLGRQVIIDAEHFPGAYKLVGETYTRSREDGKDHRYQIEIPLCKMSSNTNLTLEAAGDPTTFSMEMKVLRKDNGEMIKLTHYLIDSSEYNGVISNSTDTVPVEGLDDDELTIEDIPVIEEIVTTTTEKTIKIYSPEEDSIYQVPYDESAPYGDQAPYILASSLNDRVNRDTLSIELQVTETDITTTYEDGKKISEEITDIRTETQPLDIDDFTVTMEEGDN